MRRRQFALNLPISLAATAALPVFAQPAATPQAGRDYVRLQTPAPVSAPAGTVEVIEFFWYGCPHCNAFEPTLSAWVKRLPKTVAFRRVPVAFQSSFEPQQHLYYTLEAMGLVDKLHARVFAAIHTEKQKLTTPEAITDWVAKQGVDANQFNTYFKSFGVTNQALRARQLTAAYQVEGVPALGVAGLYYTDGSMAKSMDRALAVTEYLMARSASKA
ncbi:MAG: thiol:disulfide interchange protein DsbA [Rhodoferax sp.]